MARNPQTTARTKSDRAVNRAGVEEAYVVSSPDNTNGDVPHTVSVRVSKTNEPLPAEVPVSILGDVCVPQEGSWVTIAYRRDRNPIIVGVNYSREDTPPTYEEGERRVEHPSADARVHFKPNGDVVVDGADADTEARIGANGNIDLNTGGSVVINGGSNPAVTDLLIEKDADGHVINIDLVRSNDILVP